MNRRSFLLTSIAGAAIAQQKSPTASTRARKIVLIGGVKSHGEAQHDFPNGIPLLRKLLSEAAPFRGIDLVALPGGFPSNLSDLDGATTLIFYFDGVQTPPPPLDNPARIAEIQKVMDAGAGLVALHQASTVPEGNTSIPMIDWLGAKRNGMYDRTTESVSLKPAAPDFPVCRGMAPFTYEDEFYPTLLFTKDMNRITPVLRAVVHSNLPDAKPADHILAWGYARPNGGRSFGFTGCHYMKAFDQPEIRKMILNAICWTSQIEVPHQGVMA